MILLESQQILAAVQRSLQIHILPQLEDDFARIQVSAALEALREVSDRMSEGHRWPLSRSYGGCAKHATFG